ncbi:MAG TPA: glycosyltransferase [Saprospiraceae bacterium]|nr:glycosyltransferase [Saprospiraceae bacterium]
MGKITDLSGKLQGRRRILLCPLDWGLGHASRCVPIVEAALSLGVEVEIAGSGAAQRLLQRHFPNLIYHALPSYRVRYPVRSPFWNFFFMLPNLLYAVLGERRMLHQLLSARFYDLIVSDNRLGCYSRRVPCVYLTHQLRFAFRQKWMSALAGRMHAFWYRRFDEIWVPDFPPPDNLSGDLGIPLQEDRPVYLGPLSQLSGVPLSQNNIKYEAAAILSGPEPQRSLLEREILEQFSQLSGHYLLVRGLPKGENIDSPVDHIKIISFVGAKEIAQIMMQSRLIICRSGYSSIMDLQVLQKKALLIPTPGQPEQEYLASWHADKGQFMVQEQGKVDIEKALPFAKA